MNEFLELDGGVWVNLSYVLSISIVDSGGGTYRLSVDFEPGSTAYAAGSYASSSAAELALRRIVRNVTAD